MTSPCQLYGRSALVLYGSETGNAHDVAEELGRIVERLHFSTQVSCLDGVEPSILSTFLVIMVAVSTTGQGDLPINARNFWRSLLRKKLSSAYLASVQFTIFGLGDSSYPKFNWAARKLQKRFLQLGADEVYPMGEADEQHPEGLSASFLPWSAGLRECFLSRYPLKNGISPISNDVLLRPRWMLSLVEDNLDNEELDGVHNDNDFIDREDIVLPHDPGKGLAAPPKGVIPNKATNYVSQSLSVNLEKNERLTPSGHWQDIRHIIFSSRSYVDYEPGDVLTVYPKNCTVDVENILSMMQWTETADNLIKFTPGWSNAESKPSPMIPSFRPAARRFLTLRILLSDHLDLTAIPRRSFFSNIAHFAEDEMQRERLIEFTKPEYVDELYDYTSRPRRSILEVLQEFDSVKIPWQWVASVLPELRGRQFSIASGGPLKSGGDAGTRFDLLVAIVKYKTVIRKIREGVCTRYLAALPIGAQIQVTLQKGGLGISRKDASLPVVMIGPGTGVAPMRSLAWERFQWDGAQTGQKLGESVLFFGCRNRTADFFFEDEWATLKSTTGLQVFTAFSRDQNRKIYVQDLIEEQSDLVNRLLSKSGGIVYVCGASGEMPRSVRASLIETFKRGGLDQQSAEEYLHLMEREGRYKQETW